jgi:peptide/nickel transport system permease protein
LAQFDFGTSSKTKQRVSTMLWDGIGPSLCVTTPLFVIELALAIALALLAAYYRGTRLDRFFVVTAVIGMSVSSLVYIMLAQYWLAGEWGWFPVWGFEGPQYLVLPVTIGVLAGVGGSVRFYRTVMLDEMYQDYVRTARAKGVNARDVLFRHVLRNAMIPILTNVIVAIPFLYTGALLLESFFGIPGLGRMTVQALFVGDEDVIFATTFIGAVLFVLANLATDIAYTWADPRIRLQ